MPMVNFEKRTAEILVRCMDKIAAVRGLEVSGEHLWTFEVIRDRCPDQLRNLVMGTLCRAKGKFGEGPGPCSTPCPLVAGVIAELDQGLAPGPDGVRRSPAPADEP